MVMSPEKKKHFALQLGGRGGQERQHINVFNLGPTKQLSSYSPCRTTLFVVITKCIPHYFVTVLGTAISAPRYCTISKPCITILVLNISHITSVLLTKFLWHILLFQTSTNKKYNWPYLPTVAETVYTAICVYKLIWQVNSMTQLTWVTSNLLLLKRTANTFTWTGCKRSARQPPVKTPASFPHSATPVWQEQLHN